MTLRIDAETSTGALPELAHVLAAAGAVVVAMDLVEVTPHGATVDITVNARDDEHVEALTAAVERQPVHVVRQASDRTFLYHLGGKIEVVGRRPIRTRDDLSLAYTPGVARICSAVAARPESAWNLTAKGRTVAVVTDGTAVLGLGNLGPLAALPVMEGKAVLFKEFGGIDAYPLCLDVRDEDALIEATAAIAPGFGGINLEDIAAPACFHVEEALTERLDIPVFHDDQHGTAVVVMAALINACERTGRNLRDVRAVVVGIGAAGTAISRAMVEAGIADVVAVDRHGPIDQHRCEMHHHASLASMTNPRGVTTTADALRGADVFVGVARRGSVDPSLLQTMAEHPIVFALSNPEPEILADEVPTGAVFATGRSDFPNQINNSLCFPGFFRGLLDAKATRVTASMKQAAAHAIASCVSPAERELGIVIPSMFHPDVHRRVAEAVATA